MSFVDDSHQTLFIWSFIFRGSFFIIPLLRSLMLDSKGLVIPFPLSPLTSFETGGYELEPTPDEQITIPLVKCLEVIVIEVVDNVVGIKV